MIMSPPERTVAEGPRAAVTTGVFADLDTPDPLEAAFGDPLDAANPLGFAAFLDADERGDLLPAGERLLDRYGLGAEFVPLALGGRLDRADRLGRALRPLFRRDGALALGHGASNLVGGVNVWVAGDGAQQRRLADVLLGGGRVAAAYTDTETGNDVTGSRFTARRDGDRLLLRGRKEIVNNLGRAEAITLLARTDDAPGSRSHSLLLLDRAGLSRDHVDLLPRYRTAAVRAMYLGGMAFRDCPVPASSVVGGTGTALETMLRAFQLTRSVLPAATIGGMDTQLRTVVRFALDRRLYGRAVADLPHARAVLSDAFVDALVCDSLATVACRALHLHPRLTPLYAAAVKYLVPVLLREAVDEVGVVLGARSFLRSGPEAVFQKHLRDLPVAALVHAGASVCLATMIPQLARISRGWLADGPGEASALFRLDAPLPPLDLPALAIVASGPDVLAAPLWTARERLDGPLRALADEFVAELADLRAAVAGLAPRDRTPLAGPGSFDLAARYAVVLAAGAVLGVWLHTPGQPNAFLRDEGWVVAALTRLAHRIGRGEALSYPREVAVPELLARHDSGHAFDLVGRRLA